MARTVKLEQHAARRAEILAAARHLMFRKGFEQIAVQDILDEVKISRGAFHHYFTSRGALLDAFIEQIRQETEKPLLPIINDPKLTAIEKFQGFFNTLDQLRAARSADVTRIARVWYSDSNAIVRVRVMKDMIEQRAPLLNIIVHQGLQEGAFTTGYPNRAGYVIMTMLESMGDIHAELLLQLDQTRNNDHYLINEVVEVHAAYMDAIERTLGAPEHAFYRADFATVQHWVDLMRAVPKERNEEQNTDPQQGPPSVLHVTPGENKGRVTRKERNV